MHPARLAIEPVAKRANEIDLDPVVLQRTAVIATGRNPSNS